MKSKTKIEFQLKKKTNPDLVETLIKIKKHSKWIEVASLMSGSRRNRIQMNLGKINQEAKEGETIVVPGKVLSQGELDKKLKVVAFSFSENARKKISDSKGEAVLILDEIKKNPDFKGIKVLTGK
jgi:large subunit ribosomal protein L18e